MTFQLERVLCEKSPVSGAVRLKATLKTSKGRSVCASSLHNGTVSLFEREGFKRSRRLGEPLGGD